jgi:peptide/nickel transport system permease protein
MGTRTSLEVGVIAGIISVVVGVATGTVAGFFGGWLDMTVMRLMDVIQAIPRFFLALVAIVLLGAEVLVVALVIGVLSSPVVARVMRAQVLSISEREFVIAARATGVRSHMILLRHVLPNGLSPIIVTGSLLVGNAILIEAGLSFLGVSDPMSISLGSMLNTAQPHLRQAWWLSVFPGALIVALVLAINLLGDELNEAMDPRRAVRSVT